MYSMRIGGVLLLCLGVLGVLAGGCDFSDSETLEPKKLQAPIINGNLDTTHGAVVAVFLGMGVCSGTIIHRDGANAWVLTAAHCVTPSAPQSVAQGDDHSSPVIIYPVADYAYHPAYGGPGGLYDFAVVRITGATASTPVIPAMTPAEDNLAVGTQVRHVGYGITSYPNGYTTERHETINTINTIAVSYFDYLQPTSGPCSGDSGGAALSVGGTERVVGVISGGDQTCSQYGLSGRVSAVYDSFILPFINGTPITMTCTECFTGATSGTDTCAGVVESCYDDVDCDAYAGCINQCQTQTCVIGCAADHLAGYELYRDIYDCVCATACPTVCAGDDMCTRSLGMPCGVGGQCGSGLCVDEVCCSETCDGQCEACDIAGSVGNCRPVDGAPHGARPTCVDDGSVCGGECDGSFRSGCIYPSEISPCRALGCAAGVATLLAACDGAGTCPPSETSSCAPYLCNGDICATSCVSGTDCVVGYVCDGGICVGVDCTVDADCPDALVCRDGTCGEPECLIHSDCVGDALCEDGACIEVECVVDADCAAGLVCGRHVCEVPPSLSPGGCGCAAAGTSPGLPPVLFLLCLAWILVRRRCRISLQ